MEWWVWLLFCVGALIGGGVLGFFISRWYFKRELQKNPPVNEKMIRVMFKSMGRTASEAQIRAIMNNMKNTQ